ncbi:MAG: sensor histidine kinase [Deltaproteobacteria bacterium]|nr:sensor histidine kinase [Deltaproteobacteria bacterium]
MQIKKKGIQQRIALFILVVGIFPIIIGISLVYWQGREELTESVGENFVRIAKEIASNIEIVIEQSAYSLNGLALSPTLRNTVISANKFYLTKDDAAIEEHIKKLDVQWLQANEKKQDKEAYLNNPAAKYLAEIKKQMTGYLELFITDTKGVLVASAKKTKYLHFGNEKWWQAAYNNGKGNIYISEIYLDPDYNQYLQTIAVPIMDEQGASVAGIIRAVSTIEKISKMVHKIRIGETGHAMLINSAGIILLCPIFPPQVHRVTSELMNNITTPSLGWAVVKDNAHEGVNAIAGFAPIASAGVIENAFDGNRWYIFVSQSPEESYAPVYTHLKRLIVLFIFLVVMLSAMGFWAAGRIVEPIHILRKSAEIIGEGNLSHRIYIKTNDEIEDLANNFNQMVEKINKSYSELEQRIAERTEGLTKGYQEMEVVSRLKSEFLASMSHELRTPLNSILGFSELLNDKTYGDLNEKQFEYINYIHTSGKHLLELINDILDLSKVEAGKMEIKPEEFSVESTIKEVHSIVSPLSIRKKISVEVDIGNGISTIVADDRMFRQIMYNLLSNAIKFTNEGGCVKIRVVSNNYFLQVSVVDDGIGIKKEDMKHIFKEFKKINIGEQEGTGLGLVLVKRYVEMQGGTIRVESEYGKGSDFTFRLPVDITKV